MCEKGGLASDLATTSRSEAALHIEAPVQAALHSLSRDAGIDKKQREKTNTGKRKNKWYEASDNARRRRENTPFHGLDARRAASKTSQETVCFNDTPGLRSASARAQRQPHPRQQHQQQRRSPPPATPATGLKNRSKGERKLREQQAEAKENKHTHASIDLRELLLCAGHGHVEVRREVLRPVPSCMSSAARLRRRSYQQRPRPMM